MKRKIAITVSLTYVGWMAACFFYLYSNGETFKSIVAIGGILCGCIPLHMALFSKWQLHLGIVISYLFFLFGAQFLGTILNWYGLGWWDKAMHLISGVILGFIALVLYEGLIHRNGGNDLEPWFVFLLTVSIAAFAGVIWEIYEFSSDNFFGTTLQGTGVFDTMTDLMADVAGGLIIASYAGIRTKIRLKKHKIINHSYDVGSTNQ
jgi:hypothetical protein